MMEEEKKMIDDADKTATTSQGNPLELLLSDPERIKQIGAMVNAMLSTPSKAVESTPSVEGKESSAALPQTPDPPPQADGMDGLASLLSNPALLQSLPQILSVVKPMMENSSRSKSEPHQKAHTPSPEECRNNLLIALKPFLSKERRHAVDSIIGISRLSTVFQQLK